MKNITLFTVIVTVMILSPMLSNGRNIQEKKATIATIFSANPVKQSTTPVKTKGGGKSTRGAPKLPADNAFTLALKEMIVFEVQKKNEWKIVADEREIENNRLERENQKVKKALRKWKEKYDSLATFLKYQEKLAKEALGAKDGTIAELNRLRIMDAVHIKKMQEEIENFKVEIGRVEKMREDEQSKHYERLEQMDEIMFESSARILVNQNQVLGGILVKTPRESTLLDETNTQNVDKDRITKMYFRSIMPGDVTTYKFKLIFTNKDGVETELFSNLLADIDKGQLFKELPIDYLKKQVQNYEKGKFRLQLYYEENQVQRVRKNFEFVLSKRK